MGYDVMASWDGSMFDFEQKRRGRPQRAVSRASQSPSHFSQILMRWSPPASPMSPTFSFEQSPRRRPSPPSEPVSPKSMRSRSPAARTDSVSPARMSTFLTSLDHKALSSKLYAASTAGDLEHMSLLISLGAPVNAPTHIPALCEAFKPPKAGHLSPLAGAATHGQIHAAALLLANGAQINPGLLTSTSPPLQQACRSGDLAMARFLLHNGADVDQHDAHRSTSLMYAVRYGSTQLVSLILSYRPDLTALCLLGSTAGHWAIWPERLDILELLLEAGQDPDSCLLDESTLLHCAALKGWLDGVRLLLEFGADPFRRDGSWKTPLDIAVTHGNDEAANYLKAAMFVMS